MQVGGVVVAGSFLPPASLKSMQQPPIDSSGDLHIVPSKTSSQDDFEFLVGKWRIHNRKLKTRLKNSKEWLEFEAFGETQRNLNGFGTIDSYKTTFNGQAFEAMALRLFNPKTKLWSIYWADSNVVVMDPPVVGSFDGKIGSFYGKDFWEETPIIVQFRWDKTNADSPVWSQAFSTDNGKTWEWNWYMTFSRHS